MFRAGEAVRVEMDVGEAFVFCVRLTSLQFMGNLVLEVEFLSTLLYLSRPLKISRKLSTSSGCRSLGLAQI
jgi:hypothetical protein